MIVLDANILIRGVLGRRVRQLVEMYAGKGVRFSSPDIAFNEAEKYLPLLLKKRGIPHADVSASLEYLRNFIEPVGPELYATFEQEARQRLRGRDENDWPILASSLALACPLWT
jgi:predicted nucleic acid-binding protein